MEYPKKLIEVALPLTDINDASAHEKEIKQGHPKTLHYWWARRSHAAARAVLFASIVNDPGGERGYGNFKGQTKKDAQKERERLFKIIRKLVKWENSYDHELFRIVKAEIKKNWTETCKLTGENADKMPPFHDPFAGGGTIPIEAQRLGLETYASDLNPVAVEINRAMIDLPNRFSDISPIGPEIKNAQKKITQFKSKCDGISEDILRYSNWMRESAFDEIGDFYPRVDLPKEFGNTKGTVMAWLWARTVRSPNPAFNHVEVPLIKTFQVSKKKGKEAWIFPIIDGDKYRFEVRYGTKEPDIKGTVSRSGGVCLLSGTSIPFTYIRKEGCNKRLGKKLLAVIVEGNRQKIFLSPTQEIEDIALTALPKNIPSTEMPEKALGFRIQAYGMRKHADIYTSRQLLALETFSNLIPKLREKVKTDAIIHGISDDEVPLSKGGCKATAYSDLIATYLSFIIDRAAEYWTTLCSWHLRNQQIGKTFKLQTLSMSWDFVEANPFSNSSGGWQSLTNATSRSLKYIYTGKIGHSFQANANEVDHPLNCIISTDPPYYDNIGYANLSDIFYVWLRRSLKDIYPNNFSMMLVPKDEEIITEPARHNSKEEAELYFTENMKKTINNIAKRSHNYFPFTIYYAFKSSETGQKGTTSPGWEAFLDAVFSEGIMITGTWPIRTEASSRIRNTGSNALASSVVLVCRKRPVDSISISRKQFLRELEETLPDALEDIIGGKDGASPIAPVDLAQAAIGPGMAVFSKYSAVLEADGSPMTVHTALILINKAIDEYFTHAESDMGPDTRFCVDWFQQYGFKEGPFGEADVLARAKGTTVDGVQNAGVIQSGKGKVRLLKIKEYPSDWDPTKDFRTPIWEACHHIARALKESETTAGTLLAKMPEKAEPIRQLAYRLYTVCERKGWAEDARAYNELITSWHAIVEASQSVGHRDEQMDLFKD